MTAALEFMAEQTGGLMPIIAGGITQFAIDTIRFNDCSTGP